MLAWYESALFEAARDDRRAGALHLLNNRVERIRGGRADGVDARIRIYPVLLTYERLGDSPLLYAWVRRRCDQLGILGQDGVAPVTFVSATEYEWMLAAAARGIGIFEVLDYRANTDDGLLAFDSALLPFLKHSPLVPGADGFFDALMNETTTRLFGKPFARPRGGEESES